MGHRYIRRRADIGPIEQSIIGDVFMMMYTEDDHIDNIACTQNMTTCDHRR